MRSKFKARHREANRGEKDDGKLPETAVNLQICPRSKGGRPGVMSRRHRGKEMSAVWSVLLES